MTRSTQQLFDLSGKTALITGGSRGLGLQMAHALGEAGARVMLCARKADELEAACAELQAAGIDARWTAADCAAEADLQKLVTETLHRMGDIDILVNNAGATWGAPAQDHPVAAWDKVMNLNVRGYFLLSQLVGKHSMIGRENGAGGPHHQRGLDCRAGWQPGGDDHAGLQHQQGRRDQLHPCAGL
jgi:gluconate 5-dehydrogenase